MTQVMFDLYMKKYFIMLAAALTVAACSQSELQDPNDNLADIPANGFLAGTEGSTKVTIDAADNYSLSWEAGDEVSVYDGTSAATYTAQTAGKNVILLGGAVNADVAHYAFFPASGASAFDGSAVTALIPGEQTPRVDGFPYNPSVAYAPVGSRSLVFHNICGLVEFEIGTEIADVISNVVISGNNNENLTGLVTVDCTSATPVATVVEGKGVKSVTLQAAEGGFEAGHKYYVAILPQVFTEGITITMNSTAGKQYKKVSSPFTLNRSHRINPGTINDGTFGEENLISNAAELQAFFNVVNAAEDKGASMKAKIIADIDMSHIDTFTPAAEFAGTLDGSYQTGEGEIASYTISNTTDALFNTLTGTVSNINVNGNLKIAATGDVAFVALSNKGTISRVTTSGTISTLPDRGFSTMRAIGAIAARTEGTIENCTNEAKITVSPAYTEGWDAENLTAHQFIGGIAGYADGQDHKTTITGCTNNASVSYVAQEGGSISSMACLGGILGGTKSVAAGNYTGQKAVWISDCHNAADAALTYGFSADPRGSASNNVLIGGIVGNLSGKISSSTNSATIKVDGYRNTDDTKEYWLKDVEIGGVAGLVHVDDVTDCTNSGKIEFDATVSSGGTLYVGTAAVSSVGGVVGDMVGGTMTDCKNTGEMDVRMHMRTGNGTAAGIGGVVGTTYNTQLTNCSNEGNCNWKPFTNQSFLGGVCGYFVTDKAPSNCSNAGNLTCNAGASVAGKQSATVSFGGVFGAVFSGVQFTPSVTGYINKGNLIYSGGNTGEKRIGGVFGYGEHTKGMSNLFANVTNGYVNGESGSSNGTITVKETAADCYVGGVHGKLKMHDSSSGVAIHSSTNYAPVNVTTSGKAWVGGVVGNYTGLNAWNLVNKGTVEVDCAGAEVVVGGIAGLGYGVRGEAYNDGNITVNVTVPDAQVRVAGILANYNGSSYGGLINVTSAYNKGNITLTSAAATSYVSGLITHSMDRVIPVNSEGNIKCTYTGTAAQPVLYASLGIAHMLFHTNTGIGGTYNADIELSGFPETATKYVGIMAGKIEGTLPGSTTQLQFNTSGLSIKKGIKIDTQTVTADNYSTLLVGDRGNSKHNNSAGVTLAD